MKRRTWSAQGVQKALMWLSIAALVLSTLPLYAVSLYNHPYYDDYNFSAGVRHAWQDTGSVAQALKAAADSAAHTRRTWQGTYTGTLLSNIQPGVFDEGLYFVGTFVLLTAFIVCFLVFYDTVFGALGLGRCARIALGCLAVTLTIQFMPDVGEAFFWFNGGIGNTFIYSLLALAAALSVRLVRCGGAGAGLTAALAVLMVLLGGGSYGGGLFGLCMGAVLLAWLWRTGHGKRVHFTALWLLFAACFAYSMAAPGNAVRASYIPNSPSAAMAVVQSLYYGVAQMGQYITLPLIGITLAVLPAMFAAARRSACSFDHPWLATGLCAALYCTQLTPPLYSGVFIGGGRIVNTYFISFVALWLLAAYYLAGHAVRRLPQLAQEPPARRAAALALCGICLIGVGCMGYRPSHEDLYGPQNLAGPSAALSIVTGEAAQYHREMTLREELLGDDTLAEVTLSPLTAVPDVFMDDLVAPDAAYDVKPALRNYYRKQAVHIEGEVDTP